MRKILLTLFLAFSVSIFAENDDTFIKEDWNKALELAKETGKPILVDFYTEWCYWCKVMDKETFGQESISKKIKEEYIAVKLDAERGIGMQVAMKYRVSAYPTLGFFTSDGKLISKYEGYATADIFPNLMDSMRALNVANSNYFPGTSPELDPGYPDFYTASFGINGERTFPEDEVVQDWFAKNNNWESEVYFNVLTRFVGSAQQSVIDQYLKNKTTYTGLFGSSDADGIGEDIIGQKFYSCVKAKDEKALEQLIQNLPKYVTDETSLKSYPDNLRMGFYSRTKDYTKMVEVIQRQESGSLSNNALNTYAWDLYENCSDEECLKKAFKWMKPVVKKEPSYAFLDTYAAVAYKIGKRRVAKKYALKAIQIGKANEEDVSETQVLLGKILQK